MDGVTASLVAAEINAGAVFSRAVIESGCRRVQPCPDFTPTSSSAPEPEGKRGSPGLAPGWGLASDPRDRAHQPPQLVQAASGVQQRFAGARERG
jgi:hypothetical protein